MATLTSSYQYLGRSSVMTSTSGSLSYYLLLYGKTSADQVTGIHTVSIISYLASTNTNAEYYYYTQAHNGKINGSTAFSGSNKPSTAWTKESFVADGVTYRTWTTLGEGSINVDATDGNSKNITLSAYYAFNDTAASYTPAYGTNRTVSETVTLEAIPRATTPTVSATPYTMGTPLTINLAPANSTFKHKIRYYFGNLADQTDGLSIGEHFSAQGNTNVTFTPPITLGSQIPNANSGSCTIYCHTYTSSGTHIGTKSISITINVPSYTPTITNVSLTGDSLLSGEYVQNKSSIIGNATLTTYYGASVKSIVAEVDGKTYTTLPFKTSVLSNGSKTVKITFTDTRNKSVTYTSSAFTVYPYSAPTITAFNLERQADGTTVIATIKGSVAAVNNKNAKDVTIVLNDVTKTLTSSSYAIDATATFTGLSPDITYTGYAVIYDSFTNGSKNAVVPTVEVTMDFHHSGKGIAMGKVAEKEKLLDVAWEIKTGKPAETLSNLSYRGANVIDNNADDTVENWSKQGALATTYYNANSGLTKPSVYGFLMNLTTGQGTEEAHHLWFSQPNGDIYHRGGNPSGFGSWVKILDENNCLDYIVAQETTPDGWTYRKWNSGIAECWKTQSGSIAITTAFGTLYYGTISSVSYPFAFTDIPTVSVDLDASNSWCNKRQSSATETGIIYALSPVNITEDYKLNIIAKGRWK